MSEICSKNTHKHATTSFLPKLCVQEIALHVGHRHKWFNVSRRIYIFFVRFIDANDLTCNLHNLAVSDRNI